MNFLFFILITLVVFLAICFLSIFYFLEKSKTLIAILIIILMFCGFPLAIHISSLYKMLDITDTKVEITDYDLVKISGNYIYIDDDIQYEISNIGDRLSYFENNEEYQNKLIVTKTITYRTIQVFGKNIETYTSDINYSLYLDDFSYQYMQYKNGEREIYEKK